RAGGWLKQSQLMSPETALLEQSHLMSLETAMWYAEFLLGLRLNRSTRRIEAYGAFVVWELWEHGPGVVRSILGGAFCQAGLGGLLYLHGRLAQLVGGERAPVWDLASALSIVDDWSAVARFAHGYFTLVLRCVVGVLLLSRAWDGVNTLRAWRSRAAAEDQQMGRKAQLQQQEEAECQERRAAEQKRRVRSDHGDKGSGTPRDAAVPSSAPLEESDPCRGSASGTAQRAPIKVKCFTSFRRIGTLRAWIFTAAAAGVHGLRICARPLAERRGLIAEVTPVDATQVGDYTELHPGDIPRVTVKVAGNKWVGKECDNMASAFTELLRHGFAVFDSSSSMFRARSEAAAIRSEFDSEWFKTVPPSEDTTNLPYGQWLPSQTHRAFSEYVHHALSDETSRWEALGEEYLGVLSIGGARRRNLEGVGPQTNLYFPHQDECKLSVLMSEFVVHGDDGDPFEDLSTVHREVGQCFNMAFRGAEDADQCKAPIIVRQVNFWMPHEARGDKHLWFITLEASKALAKQGEGFLTACQLPRFSDIQGNPQMFLSNKNMHLTNKGLAYVQKHMPGHVFMGKSGAGTQKGRSKRNKTNWYDRQSHLADNVAVSIVLAWGFAALIPMLLSTKFEYIDGHYITMTDVGPD
ncbi:hypothetical protein CYMTET_4076, partial [Cymbomonas tetramitiformis]